MHPMFAYGDSWELRNPKFAVGSYEFGVQESLKVEPVIKEAISHPMATDHCRGTFEFLHRLIEDGTACQDHIGPGWRQTRYFFSFFDRLGSVEMKLVSEGFLF